MSWTPTREKSIDMLDSEAEEGKINEKGPTDMIEVSTSIPATVEIPPGKSEVSKSKSAIVKFFVSPCYKGERVSREKKDGKNVYHFLMTIWRKTDERVNI